jgi:hypothetical protein
VGDLQHERLDWSCLVTSDTASESVRERGEQYDVDIRDGKALTLGLFALVVITGTGSLAFPLLVGALLSVVYLGVLPLMVADVYLLRRSRNPPWTPAWRCVAGFLLGPIALVGCGRYWYRRRLTADGWSIAPN